MAKVKCGTLVSMVPCLSASWMPVWIFYFLYLRTSWLTHRVAFKPAAPSLSLQQPPPVPKVYIYIYIYPLVIISARYLLSQRWFYS
jgi:hypothetical protein